MNAAEFIAKWRKVELKERSAAQEHFLNLCSLLEHPTPAEDPSGESFCFEKGVQKHGGGDGFADVWKRNCFGWEYKGKGKDLAVAYDQLLRYRDPLANPPYLVVCDLDRIVVHTNFTGTVSQAFEIPLEQLGEPQNLEILRAVFAGSEKFKPGKTSEAITQEAAEQIAAIAQTLRARGLDSAEVAHFLDRVVFCMFAEDIGLLPDHVFTRIAEKAGGDPVRFRRLLGQLFAAMATGGDFGTEDIRHFNGNLFNGATVPELTAGEAAQIASAALLEWSAIEPSIFGTLFERGLDPAKRSQLGAHFTGKADIEKVVEAVVMQPLRREWDEARKGIDAALAGPVLKKGKAAAEAILQKFLARLQAVQVLDPACGSGNFLYVSLQKLKDLEKEVSIHSSDAGLGAVLPMVGPWQLHGIEINPYAHDLAQMTVWIGWLQWRKFNGFGSPDDPILRALPGNFQNKDAILDLSDPANPKEPDWPKVDFIVGNPPFLGGNRIRKELGGDYVEALFKLYKDRVPAFADLCCYWFEKARAHIENGGCKRAGLLATQGIRGGANREVIKRIKESGDIFWAVSDQDWILDGATVHVSIAAFDDGTEKTRMLDGQAVATINPDLTSGADLSQVKALSENQGICFMGASPKGPFDIDETAAREMLATTGNPNKRPNADVVRLVASGIDLTRGSRKCWTIDFGLMTMEEAAQYEAPFEYVKREVYPVRSKNRRASYAQKWWQYAEARPGMRTALKDLPRFIATPEVSRHRVFVWVSPEVLCNQQTLVFARSDDYFLGVLHSRTHEVWALAQGTQLREKESGARYTPTTSFETFPFPKPTPAQESAIADAARELVAKRDEWLAGQDAKPRHLTRLYNERPTWLDLAHKKLDAAVFAAYGWDTAMTDGDLLAALLALNLERAGAAGEPP